MINFHVHPSAHIGFAKTCDTQCLWDKADAEFWLGNGAYGETAAIKANKALW